MILDLVTRQIAVIPSLKSSNDSVPADCPCGIHAISVNPSRTLLATGAEHTNDLGIYRLPSFDPLCVAEVSFSHRPTFLLIIITRYYSRMPHECATTNLFASLLYYLNYIHKR